MQKLLKGDPFSNRYRISGLIETLSPLHIGTGEASKERLTEATRARYAKKSKDVPEVSLVMKDARCKPLIPGSTLRGVMRHWLLDVVQGLRTDWADSRPYTDAELIAANQQAQIETIRGKFSLLELLFGTPFNAGKVEVWDSICQTASLAVADDLLSWHEQSLTYVDTSVAIDPATGTAGDNLLYHTEIVPPGVVFDFNLVGQNLSEDELGLILLALRGFNSSIYPIRLGARGGRGYGRVKFTLSAIYRLDAESLGDWVRASIEGLDSLSGETDGEGGPASVAGAGYFTLPQLDAAAQAELVAKAKTKLLSGLEN